MLFEKFAEESLRIWNSYLAKVSQLQSEESLKSNGTPIYPTMAVIANYKKHYVIELMGGGPEFQGLEYKKTKGKHIDNYLNLFSDIDSKPIFHLNNPYDIFSGLCLSHYADYKAVKDRFPVIEMPLSYLQNDTGKGSVLTFTDTFKSCLIENCVVANHRENIYRCKYIICSVIVSASISKKELLQFYDFIFNHAEKGIIRGLAAADPEQSIDFIVAAQLKSIFLFPGLHETAIAEFINKHPSIIKKAFKTDRYIYEPTLEWINHDGTVHDMAINPDLLIQRADGYFDIYDFKLPKIDKRKLTKGERKKRRFVDYIGEGISQLANYREYFSYPLNAQHAEEKYGIKVRNPKLVLIAGSIENVDRQEVLQACRAYRDVDLIDYDTLASLFLSGEVEISSTSG